MTDEYDELIIAEKPSAAQKIAYALSDSKLIKKNNSGAVYYEIVHDGKKILVSSAVGHLYSLAEKEGANKWVYPSFDIEWKPTYKIDKKNDYVKKYVNNLKKLNKLAKDVTIATDYDIEGEVIGLNCMKFVCKRKDANRMKFSTLTKPDLIDSYDNKTSSIDWPQAKAGETRHTLDWFYGINISRALTLSIKKAKNYFKLLTTGRVQGPALKMLCEREHEIEEFVPVPYWQIFSFLLEQDADKKAEALKSMYEVEKIFEEDKAKEIYTNVKDEKNAKVIDIKDSEKKTPPPYPFDLTTLQTESYRIFKIKPTDSLAIAQELYTSGYISYPRTSSQKLDPKLGFKKVLTNLSKNPQYKDICTELLSKSSLKPNNGKKEDPAHPAIYPTGELPKSLNPYQQKIYDLVARRFLATFGDYAKRVSQKITFDINSYKFISKGIRTVEKGWFSYYKYVKLEETELPKLTIGQILNIKNTDFLKDETKPPNRYSQSSIIKELEKRNLGTKATRAAIIKNLYDRGYVIGENSIEVTTLGKDVILALEKYCPKIIDEKLTNDFEDDMEKIRENSKEPSQVLEKAKQILTTISTEFKENELKIGNMLSTAHEKTRHENSKLTSCPACKEGEIVLKKGKYGQFFACSKYPDCTFTISLPKGKITILKTKCKDCDFPLVSVKSPNSKQTQKVCVNPKCESNKVDENDSKNKITKKCPKCDNGTLSVKKSIYGTFLGCSNYPKCKYTEKITIEK